MFVQRMAFSSLCFAPYISRRYPPSVSVTHTITHSPCVSACLLFLDVPCARISMHLITEYSYFSLSFSPVQYRFRTQRRLTLNDSRTAVNHLIPFLCSSRSRNADIRNEELIAVYICAFLFLRIFILTRFLASLFSVAAERRLATNSTSFVLYFVSCTQSTNSFRSVHNSAYNLFAPKAQWIFFLLKHFCIKLTCSLETDEREVIQEMCTCAQCFCFIR